MGDSVLAGKVCTPPETRKTDGGKVSLSFAITYKGEPASCIAWSHMVEDRLWPLLSLLTVGSEVTLKGFWGIRQKQKDLFDAGTKEKEFVIKWASIKGVGEKSQVTKQERITQLLGGPEEADRRWKGCLNEMAERGLVWAKVGDSVYVWKKRDECVKHKGIVKHRLEYLMDVLGPAIVVDEIRRAGLNYNFADKKRYEAKIAELMEMARNFEKYPAVQTA